MSKKVTVCISNHGLKRKIVFFSNINILECGQSDHMSQIQNIDVNHVANLETTIKSVSGIIILKLIFKK